MAAQHDDNVSDDENPMPSERSTAPSINAANRDEIFLPAGTQKEFCQNNHRFNPDMSLDHPVVLEILKNHPLRFAFTLEHRVPAFYLQQFWYSMAYHPEEGNVHFTVQIDEFVSHLTISRLRRILRLPAYNAVPGLPDFEDLPTEDQMIADIRALGYDESKEPLTSLGKFKRMYLPQLYFTIFTLVNRCLTGKHTGMDKASTAVMRIFLGFVYNRHYDYASLIWTDLVEFATDRTNRRERDFIPYQRFLQLAIHHIMNRQPDIPRRRGTPLGPSYVQKFLRLNDRQFQYVMPLPEALLSLADQTALSVIEYRERHGLMAPQQPEEPAQEPNREEQIIEQGEGPRILGEQVQDQGDPEQGVERREEVRGNEAGSASDQHIPIPPPRRHRLKIGISRHHIRRLPSPPPSPPADDSEETESDHEPLQRRRRTAQAAIDRIGTQPSISESSAEAAEPSHQVQSSEPIPTTSAPATEEISTVDTSTIPVATQPANEDIDIPFDFEHSLDDVPLPDDLFSIPISGEIRRTEGDLVENFNVSTCDGTTKVIVSAIPSASIQVTESASASHPLGSTSGQDAVDLAAQLHAPPSHFAGSQQPTTSEILVGLAPYLTTLQSGATVIETRSSIPPTSTSIVCTSSLEPLSLHESHTASLRGPVGTSVVMPIPSILRGSEGNPTSATPMPTLNVGHTVYSTVVSTGNLCDPGISLTGQSSQSLHVDPATRAFVEEQHKRAMDSLAAHERTMREFGTELVSAIVSTLRKEKAPADAPSTSAPVRPSRLSTSRPSTSRSPPPPPRQSSSDDSDDSESIFREDSRSQRQPPRTQFNRNELMSMLYADLLDEAQALNQPEDELTGLLRRNLTVPTITRQEFEAYRIQVDERLARMEKKQEDNKDNILGAIAALRTEIQQSCRPAVSIPAPRHDQDDPGSAPNRPEGETRRGTRTRPQPARTSTVATPSVQPQRKRQRLTETQAAPSAIPSAAQSATQVNTPTVEKPAETVHFEGTSHAEPQSDEDEIVDVQTLRNSVKDWFTNPYEPVLQEQDYIHLRHLEEQHVEGTTSTPNLLPNQIRWQRILQESNSKWVNPQFRAPYLEDEMEKIFRKTKKQEDLAHIHLIVEMSAPEVKEYVDMLKLRARNVNEVMSRHPIIGIMQITSDKIFHVEYPIFKVRRGDGKEYVFSEADFKCLDIHDLEILYTELKDKIKRTKEEKLAYRALVRYIQKQLRYNYLYDFQRGIESGQKKVHIVKPNQRFPGLDKHKVATVLEEPDHGVVWMHPKGELRFLRFDEIAAYSDGTLTGIRNRLYAELSEDKKKEFANRMKSKKRNAIDRAIQLIDERLLFRSTLRRFEGMFELKRSFRHKGGDC